MRKPIRKNRSEGFSLLEVTISLGILGYGMLSIAAMQLQALSFGANGKQYRQAVEIAKDQMELVQILPWTELAPTTGYEAPAWISVPGYAAGELPVRVDLPDAVDGAVDQVYTVAWRVADANVDATLREVDVRVTWTEASQRARTFAISSVRAK